MTDKILALSSLLCLVAFLGVLIAFLVEVDLTIVIVGVLAMAAYDFYYQIFGKGKGTDL